MRIKKPFVLLLAAVFGGLPSLALAETASQAGVSASELQELKAQIQELRSSNQQLQSEVRGLRADHGDNWLNQRRTEEVKALVRDVLADADTRASLQESAMTAGHNGQNFFMASADGTFLMQVAGIIQLRYVFDHRHGDAPVPPTAFLEGPDIDRNRSGFEVNRAKLEFSGHIGSPRFLYLFRFGPDREDNEVLGERLVVGFQVSDNLTIYGGEDKAPFMREEIIDPGHQLAVERSLMNEVFTAGYIQGAWLKWEPTDYLTVNFSINDGIRSGEADNEYGGEFILKPAAPAILKPFDLDRTDVALTGRVDWRVMGDWSQWNDFAAWQGEPTGLFLGAAIHYEVGETGSSAANNNFLVWTVDGSFEHEGFNAFASFAGAHSDFEMGTARSVYGFMAQAGYMVIPDKLEPFARVEWISIADPDSYFDSGNNDLTILTFGANYYVNKHNAKFTVDVVWALESIQDGNIDQHPIAINDPSNVNLLFDDTGKEDQVAVRAQFQLLF